MTDYKFEQDNEIEALQAIYPDEITILESAPYHAFIITVNSTCDRRDAEQVSFAVRLQYTEKYPDEDLIYEIQDEENLEEDEKEVLEEFIKDQISENLGMVVVFTIITALQEKVNDLVEGRAQKKEEEADRKKQEIEEAERKRLEGTRVTIESFLAWKEKFMAEVNSKKEKRQTEKKDPSKLTGKELFLTDRTLDDSDVTFLDDGDPVEVDESLFEDVDDLALEDELSDES